MASCTSVPWTISSDGAKSAAARSWAAGTKEKFVASLGNAAPAGGLWKLAKTVKTRCGKARVFTASAEGEGEACLQFKVVGYVPCAPAAAARALLSFERRKAWDKTVAGGRVLWADDANAGGVEGGEGGAPAKATTVEAVDLDAAAMYAPSAGPGVTFCGLVTYRTGKVGPVASREFVDLRTVEVSARGDVWCYASGVRGPARECLPQTPGVVQGNNFEGIGIVISAARRRGALVEGAVPAGSDAAECPGKFPVVSAMTMTSHTNPGGQLPKWLTNKATISALLDIFSGLQGFVGARGQREEEEEKEGEEEEEGEGEEEEELVTDEVKVKMVEEEQEEIVNAPFVIRQHLRRR
jgi:hypothetical protein